MSKRSSSREAVLSIPSPHRAARHTGFQMQERGLRLRRCAIPDFWWQRHWDIHEAI
jgi:hypothetical protein